MSVSPDQIAVILERIVGTYPPDHREAERASIPRLAYHIHLVSSLPRGARIADVGGGFGLFTPGCAAMGYSAILVDDFADRGHREIVDAVMDAVHRPLGVELRLCDAISGDFGFEPESLDAVTLFGTIEHWHHSPKTALHALTRALKPKGMLIIGGPNCVNLRKRITVPLGVGKWSAMEYYYEEPVFRSHVREPDIDDYRYIARDLGLQDLRIFGRNWVASSGLASAAMPAIDRMLRLMPGLCAEIYMVGQKP